MKCKCGNHRFRTRNSAANIFACRRCGAIYQNGEFVKDDPNKDAERRSTKDHEFRSLELAAQIAKVQEKVEETPVKEPEVLIPEVATPAQVAAEEIVTKPQGVLGTLKRLVTAMLSL
jgi:hypothetical protein